MCQCGGGEGSVPDFPGMSESGLLLHGSHTRSRSSLPIHVQQLGILTNSQPLTEIIDMTEQLEYTHHGVPLFAGEFWLENFHSASLIRCSLTPNSGQKGNNHARIHSRSPASTTDNPPNHHRSAPKRRCLRSHQRCSKKAPTSAEPPRANHPKTSSHSEMYQGTLRPSRLGSHRRHPQQSRIQKQTR